MDNGLRMKTVSQKSNRYICGRVEEKEYNSNGQLTRVKYSYVKSPDKSDWYDTEKLDKKSGPSLLHRLDDHLTIGKYYVIKCTNVNDDQSDDKGARWLWHVDNESGLWEVSKTQCLAVYDYFQHKGLERRFDLEDPKKIELIIKYGYFKGRMVYAIAREFTDEDEISEMDITTTIQKLKGEHLSLTKQMEEVMELLEKLVIQRKLMEF